MIAWHGLERFVVTHGCVLTVVAFTAGVAGCGTGSSGRAPAVRDSAGVRIVESRAAAWGGSGRWSVAESPLLDIGSSEGPEEYQFYRVAGALRLADGRIVVADGGSSEIRIYDSAGNHQRTSGGPGDAPGEYRMIAGLGAGPGDSLWVYDYGNRRFSVLTGDGETVRTVSVGGFLSAANSVGRLPDGRFVVKEGWGRSTSGASRTGLVRDPVAVVLLASDGTSTDTLGMFPGREVFVSVEDGRAVMSTPLFAHNAHAALRGTSVVVGVQETMEIRLYSAQGTLQELLRVPNANLHLSASDIEARKQDVVSLEAVERQALARRQLDELAVPDSRPAYGRLLVGEDGSIWAGEHTRYPAVPRTWTVFSSDGRLLGEVVMPERFNLLQIGNDFVLGIALDDLDVEHVRLYPLEK